MLRSRISIIIPFYGILNKIPKCLDSVLAQDYKDYEVIIVDDCSPDQIKLNGFHDKVRILRINQRRGPGHARNIGAKNAKADTLFFIDSDVILPRNALRLIENSYNAYPAIAGVVGLYSTDTPYKNFSSVYKNLMVGFEDRSKKDFISTFRSYAFSMKKKFFIEVGGFNETLGLLPCEDFEFAVRLEKEQLKFYLNRKLEVIHSKKFTFQDLIKQDIQRVKIFYFLSNELAYFKRPEGTSLRYYVISRINFFIPLFIILTLFISIFNMEFLYIMSFIIAGYILINAELAAYFIKTRGISFVFPGLGMLFVEMLISELVLGFTLLVKLLRKNK